MKLLVTIHFSRERDRDEFQEREIEHINPAFISRVETEDSPEEGALPAVHLAIGSPAAAREIGQLIQSFLRQGKRPPLLVRWPTSEQENQEVEIRADHPAETETMVLRLIAALKSMEDEKSTA